MWNELLYRPIYNALIIVYNFLPYKDVGLAIIVLTLLIRFVLLPLSWSALKSQRILQSLNPELDRLKEKYKDDKEKLTKATMDFYQKHKISPLSSCLPMLIQLPILIALYQVLRAGIDHTQYELLYSFVQQPESFNEMFLGIIDLSLPFWPLAILTGIAQFLQSYLLKPLKAPQKPQAKAPKKEEEAFSAESITANMGTQFVYIMPLMTVFIAWNLFAGLPLYWVTSTLFSVISQLIIIRRYPIKQIEQADAIAHDHPEQEFSIEPEVLETYQEKNVNISVKKRNQ
ncbi:YidC/Oxa1 family membrane protein insertase [Patescibacteria group bacterium]|nr:YidC/Oxa1 family membrane protein insertase [Patescibacteria group bacterium]